MMAWVRPARARQRGVGTVLQLFLITAAVGAALFSLDATRTVADAAQLKRATDAAALAVAQAHARDADVDVPALARQYVVQNLGTDAALLSRNLSISTSPVETAQGKGFRVQATFVTEPLMAGVGAQPVTVASSAIARFAPLEVALVTPVDNSLDNTALLSGANTPELSAVRQLGKDFADRLFALQDGGQTYDAGRDIWLSIVPFGQAVNVYDAQDPNRITRWTKPGGLRPVELTALWRSGYSGLADRRMPDRITNRLCMFRGLFPGENFFWDRPPSASFGVYYRADLSANAIDRHVVTWIGPNPMFGLANGVNDVREMITDRGCPSAPVLPLSNDRDEIFRRFDELRISFNANYVIGLGWGGAMLSPAMRGSAGLGDRRLPLDFNEDRSRPDQKVIVMLAKFSGLWMDTDAYNYWVDYYMARPLTGGGDNSAGQPVRQRYIDLCTSYRARGIRVHVIAVVDPSTPDAANFQQLARPGLEICAGGEGSLDVISSSSLIFARDKVSARLEAIAQSLRRDASFVSLVQ